MKIIENKNAKKIIEFLVPKSILDLNPVIAGGSIVAIYYICMKYKNSAAYDEDLMLKIEYLSKTWSKSKKDLFVNFKDIDLWFLADNEIWSEDSFAHPLISDLEKKQELLKKQFMEENNKRNQNAAGVLKSFSLFPLGAQPLVSVVEPDVLRKFYLHDSTKFSSWANTFNPITGTSVSLPIQFIKKPYKDIDELFSKFDLINCCAAYYNGYFYFHDDFEKSHLEHLLEKGEAFCKTNLLNRIWTMERCFKYYERYQLEFTEEICSDCVELMLYTLDLTKDLTVKITPEQLLYSDCNLSLAQNLIDDMNKNKKVDENPYGKVFKMSQIEINDVFNLFIRRFSVLIRMKNFNKSNIFLFLKSQLPEIKSNVTKYLEEYSEIK